MKRRRRVENIKIIISKKKVDPDLWEYFAFGPIKILGMGES